MQSSNAFVYRLMTRAVRADCLRSGVLQWQALDRRDGFFHLSNRSQLIETAMVHFADCRSLCAAAVRADVLQPALQYESVAARGGDVFAHYYGVIDIAQVDHWLAIAVKTDGSTHMEDLQ